MDPKALEALVSLSDRLDSEGLTNEAQALDEVLAKVAERKMNKKAMTGGAMKACKSLLRACESFCKKNLDSRGENRRELNGIVDMCEDMVKSLSGICDND